MIRARELLEEITVSSYPHTKPEAQKKKHKDIHKTAFPSTWNADKKPLSLEELAKVLGSGR
jgi:hypothetical protein